MSLRQIARIAVLATGLAGAFSATSAAPRADSDPTHTTLLAANTDALLDGGAGRAVPVDYLTNVSGVARAAYATPQAAYADSGSMGMDLRGRAGTRESAASIGKVRLGAANWLLLTGVVGLLGAARRRRAAR